MNDKIALINRDGKISIKDSERSLFHVVWNPAEVAEHWRALIEYIAKKLSELSYRYIGDDYVATMNEMANALFYVAEQNIEALEKLAHELGDE